jgi:hypothetical protein
MMHTHGGAWRLWRSSSKPLSGGASSGEGGGTEPCATCHHRALPAASAARRRRNRSFACTSSGAVGGAVRQFQQKHWRSTCHTRGGRKNKHTVAGFSATQAAVAAGRPQRQPASRRPHRGRKCTEVGAPWEAALHAGSHISVRRASAQGAPPSSPGSAMGRSGPAAALVHRAPPAPGGCRSGAVGRGSHSWEDGGAPTDNLGGPMSSTMEGEGGGGESGRSNDRNAAAPRCAGSPLAAAAGRRRPSTSGWRGARGGGAVASRVALCEWLRRRTVRPPGSICKPVTQSHCCSL